MKDRITITYFNDIEKKDSKDFLSLWEKSGHIDFLEPDDLPFFLAYKNNIPVGALTYFISSYYVTPEADIDDRFLPGTAVLPLFDPDTYEAEITAFVIPEERNKGICRLLFDHAANILQNEFKDTNIKKIVYSLPEFMSRSSFASRPDYSEYLLSTDKDTYIPGDTKKILSDLYASETIPEDFGVDVCYVPDDLRFDLLINKKRVGCLSVDIAPSRFLLHNVYLSPKLRGMKLGSFLLTKSLEHLFSLNNIPVMVNTRSTNYSAVGLYKSAGFKIIDQLDFYARTC